MHSVYIINHPDLTVSNFKENCIGLKKVNAFYQKIGLGKPARNKNDPLNRISITPLQYGMGMVSKCQQIAKTKSRIALYFSIVRL